MSANRNGQNGGTIFNTLELTSDFGENVPLELYNDDLEFTQDGNILSIERRAKSKYLTTLLANELTKLNSPIHDKYEQTFFCSHSIQKTGNVCKSTFCKKRWCVICNRIRTAQLMQTYLPTIETWKNKQFVTLTIKNVPADKLKPSIVEMYKSFAKMKDNLRKTYKTKLVGIRKLEITYNKADNEYHPHYHMITENDKSDFIIKSWLKSFPDASAKAQDSKAADDGSCKELFKYFTKLTSNSSKDKTISVHALDTIFQNISGIRTFQPFGFIAHVPEPPPKEEEEQAGVIIEPEIFNYQPGVFDWCSTEGELLTNFNKLEYDHYTEKFDS
jgi:hypothetical protein